VISLRSRVLTHKSDGSLNMFDRSAGHDAVTNIEDMARTPGGLCEDILDAGA
jgi:hypothetical protein